MIRIVIKSLFHFTQMVTYNYKSRGYVKLNTILCFVSITQQNAYVKKGKKKNEHAISERVYMCER